MAFFPSSCTSVSVSAPSPQATVNRPPGKTSPGSPSRPVLSSSILRSTFSRLPFTVVHAPGHGFSPRIRLWSSPAGRVKSSAPIPLSSIGASDILLWSWGARGTSPPPSNSASVRERHLAPRSDSRRYSSPLVSSSPTGVVMVRMVSPASNSSAINMVVTPAVSSPLITVH